MDSVIDATPRFHQRRVAVQLRRWRPGLPLAMATWRAGLYRFAEVELPKPLNPRELRRLSRELRKLDILAPPVDLDNPLDSDEFCIWLEQNRCLVDPAAYRDKPKRPRKTKRANKYVLERMKLLVAELRKPTEPE